MNERDVLAEVRRVAGVVVRDCQLAEQAWKAEGLGRALYDYWSQIEAPARYASALKSPTAGAAGMALAQLEGVESQLRSPRLTAAQRRQLEALGVQLKNTIELGAVLAAVGGGMLADRTVWPPPAREFTRALGVVIYPGDEKGPFLSWSEVGPTLAGSLAGPGGPYAAAWALWDLAKSRGLPNPPKNNIWSRVLGVLVGLAGSVAAPATGGASELAAGVVAAKL